LRNYLVLAVILTGTPAARAQSGDAFVAKIPSGQMASSIMVSPVGVGTLAGHTVEVPLVLTMAGAVTPAAFQIDLTFDPQVLSFLSARVGAQLAAAGKGLVSTLVSSADVRLSTTSSNQNTIAAGLVAYASFSVGPKFGPTTALIPLNCIAAGLSGAALSTGCLPASLTTFSCDSDGDGQATVADVQSLINQALGLTPATRDLNHDGVVNVADVQKQIDAVLGLGCVY
jgi:hypothetical protein